MTAGPQPNPQEESEQLDIAIAQAIEACGGDMWSTIRALLLANEFLETELKANTSKGYKRGYAHGKSPAYTGSCGVRAMIDIANSLKEPLDISDDLKRCLNDSAYWYLSAWEFDPEAHVEDTDIVRDEVKEEKDGRMAEIFEKLRDSVDAIPQFIIAKTAELHATVGHERYEQLVGFSVKNVGRTTLPNNATEFVQSLNLLMQYNASETSRFG